MEITAIYNHQDDDLLKSRKVLVITILKKKSNEFPGYYYCFTQCPFSKKVAKQIFWNFKMCESRHSELFTNVAVIGRASSSLLSSAAKGFAIFFFQIECRLQKCSAQERFFEEFFLASMISRRSFDAAIVTKAGHGDNPLTERRKQLQGGLGSFRAMESCYICCFAAAMILFCCIPNADAYDPLDPNGNITIKWDIISWAPGDGYTATVTMFNWQQYRHISAPGWTLGWHWGKKEVILSMVGAQTTSQGDCSQFHTNPLPHCCAPNPNVVDLLPGVAYNQQVANCCRGGVISSYAQDPATALSAFQLTVGNSGSTNTSVVLPKNFTLQTPGPGYSCGPAVKVAHSLFLAADGRRTTQAFMTWNVTCFFSQHLAQKAPTCCVSLSTFYSPTITPCTECACSCASNSTATSLTSPVGTLTPGTCLDPNTPYSDLPNVSRGANTPANQADTLFCTTDMCPVKIHWHVKLNYQEYWRVKITITNRDFSRNFSDWTLAVQHPNFDNFTEAFSFNYKGLNPYGTYTNDSAVFWGMKYFNEMLMEAGPSGNVQSEILFRKESDFKFSNGWAFPHRVYFNGDDCVLPNPQDYPTLPNSSPRLNVGMAFLVAIIAAIGAFSIEILF